MGRYSKPPGQTRRPERHHWRTLDGGASVPAPPMPESAPEGGWHPEAEHAWLLWWASPMAGAWIAADTVALRRAIRLVDEVSRGMRGRDGALVALLDRLGLTPAGRLRSQWLVEREPKPAPVVTLAPKPQARDPRERV